LTIASQAGRCARGGGALIFWPAMERKKTKPAIVCSRATQVHRRCSLSEGGHDSCIVDGFRRYVLQTGRVIGDGGGLVHSGTTSWRGPSMRYSVGGRTRILAASAQSLRSRKTRGGLARFGLRRRTVRIGRSRSGLIKEVNYYRKSLG